MTDRLRIACLTQRHFDEVLAIERASFEFPWSARDFEQCVACPPISGIVVEIDGSCRRPLVLGYAVYELKRHAFQLLNIAVENRWRRRGIGRAAVNHLKQRLQADRARIRFDVRETNLPGQLFLRSLGFEAVQILPRYYNEYLGAECEAAYRFVYRLPTAAAICPAAVDAVCEGTR